MNIDEFIEIKKIKIPVQVMENLLHAAMRGFLGEDPHNTIELDSEEFTFFSRLVELGMLHSKELTTKAWVDEELEFFWRLFEPSEVTIVSKPSTNQN